MLKKQPLNYDWEFIKDYQDSYLKQWPTNTELVDLPHTVAEIPLTYIDQTSYQGISIYRKRLDIEKSFKKIFIHFEGVMVACKVYLNDIFLGEHLGGYTPFNFELTPHLKDENWLYVVVDSNERADIPPFGGVVDYLCYGGIYREVELHYHSDFILRDVYFKTVDVLTNPLVQLEFTLINLARISGDIDIECHIGDINAVCFTLNLTGEASQKATFSLKAPEAKLWDIHHPQLYDAIINVTAEGILYDSHHTRIGFRTAEFKRDGFYLNNKKLDLVGLNRHQSYPYVGYAMPARAQIKDADILKYDLGVNVVRTSHYPQSKHFLDYCDAIGLLVFCELPGWQHIGDLNWQATAVTQLKEMMLRDRNHPSIILWGTRINESMDNHDFYAKTTETAKSLDNTRATTGVRYIHNSELLEDVYAFNDFSYQGVGYPIMHPKDVFKEDKPYIISEHSGHMFPTKTTDNETRRVTHALRHLNIINAALGDNQITGVIGWCFVDYNTHFDFGSGDSICHHGVMDMFRLPKYAAYAYASQRDDTPYLQVLSGLNVGEHNVGLLPDIYIATNCDAVNIYRNDEFIGKVMPDKETFKHLKHAPIKINDFMSQSLINHHGFSEDDAKRANCIMLATRDNYGSLSESDQKQMKDLITKYRLDAQDLPKLYTKYVGGWGEAARTFKFEGIINNKIVKTVICGQGGNRLTIQADDDLLKVGETYDTTRIVVQIKNDFDQILTYSDAVIELVTDDKLAVIGPAIRAARGGQIAFWVKTLRKTGEAKLKIKSSGYKEHVLHINITH